MTNDQPRLLAAVLAITGLFLAYLLANLATAPDPCVWSVGLDDNVACVDQSTADLHECYAATMRGPNDLTGKATCDEGN